MIIGVIGRLFSADIKFPITPCSERVPIPNGTVSESYLRDLSNTSFLSIDNLFGVESSSFERQSRVFAITPMIR